MRLNRLPGIERALARALRWAVAGGVASLALLAMPQPAESQLLGYTIVHLGVLVTLGLVVTSDLVEDVDASWFAGLGPWGRRTAAGAAVVALTVGVVALITLPSSAALRLAPSLQFLQLLSALDIAWAAGATMVGVRWWLGRRQGAAAGAIVGIVCVWSLWRYLDVVGFAGDGGWLVDGRALFTYVLPYDVAAAVVAVVALLIGSRRASVSEDASRTA